MKNFKVIGSTLFVGLLVFSGCGGGGTATDNSTEEVFNGIERTIDATAGGFNAPADDPNNKYTYFDFSENRVLNLTDEEAKTNTEWDIAFRRLNIKLNGGASGIGDVAGAVADMQSELYDSNGEVIPSKIMAMDDKKGLIDFNRADKNVTAFLKDSTGSVIAKEWWRDFDMSSMPPILKANDDNWFVVRSSTGDSYAKMHATKVEADANRALKNLRLEMYIQRKGESEFSDTITVADINFTTGVDTIYYDFDTASIVNENDEWDLKIDKDWTIWTNSDIYGGGKGGAFGSSNGITLAALNAMITDGGKKADSGENVPKYFPDAASSIFKTYSWYEFNINGNHKVWPNYRVYIIKVGDSEKYKVQLINYYNDDTPPVSGYITFRYEALTN